MTRKDYELLAEAIGFSMKKAVEHTATPQAGLYFLAGALSEMLVQDNPRFDRDRFFNAIEKHKGVAA